jgi:hypothetical protein
METYMSPGAVTEIYTYSLVNMTNPWR